MKKIITLIAVFAILTGYSQDCYNTALGISYLVPKGAGVEVMISGKFQGGAGVLYTPFTTTEKNKHSEKFDLDILTYGGVRFFHRKYRSAAYVNAGATMGMVRGPRFYSSLKWMFLRNQRAYSIEPYYLNKLGLKLTYYIRL